MELKKGDALCLPKGYKQTEVGVIPEDWEVKNITDNSTMKARIGWQGLTTSEYLKMGDYFLVTGTDFFDGKIKWETCHYVNKERYIQDRNIQVKKKDILITKDGTIGKVAYIGDLPLDATLNSGVFVIRPVNGAYDTLYCYYIFHSRYFETFLRKLVAGSTINHLYQKDFVSFKFPLPPTITEQAAIATALSDADALISSLEKLIEKKRAIKQGAMQELLKPKEGWVVKKLREVAEFNNGKAHEQFIEENGDYIVINSKFVSTGGEIAKNSKVALSQLCKGDIAMVMSDIPNGKALAKCFMVNHNNKYTLNQRICSISSHDCYSDYLFLILNRNDYFLAFDSGTGQTNLKKQEVLECPIPLPVSIEEQKKIAQILNDMTDEIFTLEQNLSKYKMLKQGMMQELLTGRIRIGGLIDEQDV